MISSANLLVLCEIITQGSGDYYTGSDAKNWACSLKFYSGAVLFLLPEASQINTRSLVYLVRKRHCRLNRMICFELCFTNVSISSMDPLDLSAGL